MIQASGSGGGTIRIRSTGYAGPGGKVMRTLVANLREQSLTLDYEWFTNFETSGSASPGRLGLSDLSKGTPDNTLRPPDQCVTNPPANCGSNYSVAVTGAGKQCGQYRFAGRYSNNAASYGTAAFFKDTSGSYYCDQTTANESLTNVPNNGIQFVSGDTINGPFHTNDQGNW